MGAFSCSGCGACCRQVKRVHPDWPTRVDGSCVHLTQDNRCDIYATRPRACRVDEARPHGLAVETWHRLNAEVCTQLQAAEAT